MTLPMLTGRTYIVTSPSLAAYVQRASKALSFNPIIAEVTRRVLGFNESMVKIMRSGIESEDERGFVGETQDLLYARLAPGESLDELTQAAGTEFLGWVNRYRERLGKEPDRREGLLNWTKYIVTVATAKFLYGPQNPIAMDPPLKSRFWDFDAGIPGLLLGLYPSITARAAYKGREALVEAFNKYLAADKQTSGSSLVQARKNIADKYGLDIDSTARCEASFLFAGVTNTAITSFWLVLSIFARPALLSKVREELESTLGDVSGKDAARKISIKRITKECKVLLSTYREVLRVYSDNSSTRMVTDDTLLADQYFLKKGSILQISGAAIHNDQTVWGEDVKDFKPDRFLEEKQAAKSIRPAAFRAFGGGATLCPGRHFALNEILALVSMIVLLFDMKPIDEQDWKLPNKKDDVLPIHILEPLSEAFVNMRLREGWEKSELQLEA